MKLFAPALIFCGAIASFGQSPQVPHKMQFAGMTLTIRDDARREIQADVDALTKSPKYFDIKAERAKTYFPIIERVFTEERLPADFRFLALQESALIADAVSTSNAVGFWQFKDFTAIEMGLRVDRDIDERMNIASASRGAAKYIKQCNHYFNNWIYALQAYQMGAGGVMRQVGDRDLGSRHMEITSETYWYVKKFLAHKVAFEHAVEGPGALEVVSLSNTSGKSLEEIAKEASIDEEQLRTFNKWLKAERIPDDRDYTFLVPKGQINPEFTVLTIAGAPSKPQSAPPLPAPAKENLINGIPVIQAQAGESLTGLATRAGINLNRFLSYNEMDITNPIYAGQWYFIEKKKKHTDGQELYTAKAGENLWAISQRFGVRIKMLKKYNAVDERTSLEGKTLFLSYHRPGSVTSPSDTLTAMLDEEGAFEWDVSLAPKQKELDSAGPNQPASGQNLTATGQEGTGLHEVRPSDTLYSVARQYGVTIKEIMEWNGKKDFSLAIGEKLRVVSR